MLKTNGELRVRAGVEPVIRGKNSDMLPLYCFGNYFEKVIISFVYEV